MLGGGVNAATLVAALGAGPPPPECRWGRRPHRGATACRLLERDDRGVNGPGQLILIKIRQQLRNVWERATAWPLHDFVITNIVWCIACKREVGRGVVYYPISMQ